MILVTTSNVKHDGKKFDYDPSKRRLNVYHTHASTALHSFIRKKNSKIHSLPQCQSIYTSGIWWSKEHQINWRNSIRSLNLLDSDDDCKKSEVGTLMASSEDIYYSYVVNVLLPTNYFNMMPGIGSKNLLWRHTVLQEQLMA